METIHPLWEIRQMWRSWLELSHRIWDRQTCFCRGSVFGLSVILVYKSKSKPNYIALVSVWWDYTGLSHIRFQSQILWLADVRLVKVVLCPKADITASCIRSKPTQDHDEPLKGAPSRPDCNVTRLGLALLSIAQISTGSDSNIKIWWHFRLELSEIRLRFEQNLT